MITSLFIYIVVTWCFF